MFLFWFPVLPVLQGPKRYHLFIWKQLKKNEELARQRESMFRQINDNFLNRGFCWQLFQSNCLSVCQKNYWKKMLVTIFSLRMSFRTLLYQNYRNMQKIQRSQGKRYLVENWKFDELSLIYWFVSAEQRKRPNWRVMSKSPTRKRNLPKNS